MKNIFVLVSGKGSLLEPIIKHSGTNILRLFSNKDCKALHLDIVKDTKKVNLSRNGKLSYDKLIGEILLHKPKLIVLAGYLKILPENVIYFCYGLNIPIINIHPSLLPKYKGLDTYNKVVESKDKFHGITIHYVNAELDSGKIIKRFSFPISNMCIDRIINKTKEIEKREYPKIIASLVNS